MSPFVIALVLASALLHAGWSASIKQSGDPLCFNLLQLPVLGLLFLLLLPFVSLSEVPARVWWLLPATALAHTAYVYWLCRAFEHGELSLVYPITEIAVDVRVVCATHRDLQQLIAQGTFREDLYYRLAEIVVTVPPLRDRPGDAVLLAHSFARRYADEQKRARIGLSDEALAAIERHRWPGNVRELENVMKRAVILADGPVLRASDLGLDGAAQEEEPLNLREARDSAERA